MGYLCGWVGIWSCLDNDQFVAKEVWVEFVVGNYLTAGVMYPISNQWVEMVADRI